MTWALVVAVLAGGLGCAILWAMVQGQKARADAKEKECEDLKKQVSAISSALELEKLKSRDENSRLEAVIASLKKEIASLEADLSVNRDPDAVRERLRRLLAGP